MYFARPDSEVFGQSVNEVRTSLGRLLAKETAVPADVVVPIPDSGVCAAIGYAEEAGLPMRFGLIRNHYVGRVHRTGAVDPSLRRGEAESSEEHPRRSVVLVDDSIVRGTQPEDRQDGPRRRRERSPSAHQLSADGIAVLLRC